MPFISLGCFDGEVYQVEHGEDAVSLGDDITVQ
jgi:hypothetical protein